MGVPKALERAKEAAIGRFLPPQKCAREALGYFPNSFSMLTSPIRSRRFDRHTYTLSTLLSS
jgi:hypothetical protein